MKKLGIIGGMGPMATAYFFERVTALTEATKDSEHIDVLLHSVPGIPDRTAYIIGKSELNPFPQIVSVGRNLIAMGAEILAIPCVTAHFFKHDLEKKLSVPVMDGVAQAAEYLEEKGIRNVGIMATDGTIESGLFNRQFDKHNLVGITPSKERQKLVMSMIYDDIKAGKKPEYSKLAAVEKELKDMGAEVILLGCTELSLMRMGQENDDRWAGYVDVLEVLAKKTVDCCME